MLFRRRPLVVALAVAAGLVTVPGARAGQQPVVVGADFAVSAYANTVRGVPPSQRGLSMLVVSGHLRTAAVAHVPVHGTLRAPSGDVLRFDAYAKRWQIDYSDSRVTLTFTLRMVSTNAEGCPAGAKGTLVVTDDDTRLPSGRSSDRVSLRFEGAVCATFARTWSNGADPRTAPLPRGGGKGQWASVKIALLAGTRP